LKGPLLVAEEWDFERLRASLREEEVSVCYHYEFSREVPRIRQGISAIRHLPSLLCGLYEGILDDKSFELFMQRNPYSMDYSPVYLWQYPEWPDTPYLRIKPATRAKRIKEMIPDETTNEARASQLEPPLGIENPNLWPEIKLAIPIYRSHQQLIEAFGAYLRVHFPDQGKAGKKRAGSHKPGHAQGGAAEIRRQRNALRALGVCRLSQARMKAAQIAEFLKNAQGKPLYASESAVNRAKALAKVHLASFETSGVYLGDVEETFTRVLSIFTRSSDDSYHKCSCGHSQVDADVYGCRHVENGNSAKCADR
jgi:hypothetical protein